MSDKNRTTLSGISLRQNQRLRDIALELIDKTNLSALWRHIADNGRIENGKLVVESPTKGVKEAHND
jgi:hypothetical protein